MARLSPTMQARLEAAHAYALASLEAGHPPAAIIAALVEDHGAVLTTRPDANRLRCCGIAASCTWSKDRGLLAAWRKNAHLHLVMANYQ